MQVNQIFRRVFPPPFERRLVKTRLPKIFSASLALGISLIRHFRSVLNALSTPSRHPSQRPPNALQRPFDALRAFFRRVISLHDIRYDERGFHTAIYGTQYYVGFFFTALTQGRLQVPVNSAPNPFVQSCGSRFPGFTIAMTSLL